MKVTPETSFHLVLALAYSKTAQTYKDIDWGVARCFVDLAMEHWRKVKWL